jgi:predicted acyl esterase
MILDMDTLLNHNETANDPALWGLSEPREQTEHRDGMVIHWDVAIPTRDVTMSRGSIFRPEIKSHQKLPVVLSYSVYGKDWGVETAAFPAGARLDNSRYSSYYNFEACDALWWTQRGYIVAFVDVRGSLQSEGDKIFFSRDVGLDGRVVRCHNEGSLVF